MTTLKLQPTDVNTVLKALDNLRLDHGNNAPFVENITDLIGVIREQRQAADPEIRTTFLDSDIPY